MAYGGRFARDDMGGGGGGGLRSLLRAGRWPSWRAADVPPAGAALAAARAGGASARCTTQPLRYTSEAPPKPHR